MNVPMPLDFNVLINRIGQQEVTIMQLQYQIKMLSDELTTIKNKSEADHLAQQLFDDAVDRHNLPSGGTTYSTNIGGH